MDSITVAIPGLIYRGRVTAELQKLSPERIFTGIDVVAREACMIPCHIYDGEIIPFPPNSFDIVLFVDVLHHTKNPWDTLSQAVKIARSGAVIKDHYAETTVDHLTLSFMDWVGNAQYGIALPNNYKSRKEWKEAYKKLSLKKIDEINKIELYPQPFDLIFGRGLHFISLLSKE